MTAATDPGAEEKLLARARGGDAAAFGELVRMHREPLRAYLVRLVAHMEDADDLVQEATLKAHDKLDTFRGESSFKTWLHAIATRLALTHLEGRRRWPSTAQLSMHEKADASPAFLADLGAAVNGPDFQYDVAEHVAYCFACVGRSLEPETSAALLLVEVFDFKNMEAASILGLSESTLRHRLAAARAHMETTFDGLCALVNKGGACHQCATLRGMCPPGRQGPAVETLAPDGDAGDGQPTPLGPRIDLVKRADLRNGSTHTLHDRMLRFIAQHLD